MEHQHILLIGDDASLLQSIRLYLRDYYALFVASSPAEADLLLQKKNVDLLLIDSRMQTDGAVDLLARLRALPGYAEIPAIVFANGQDEAAVDDSETCDNMEIMCMPFKMEALLQTVNRYMMALRAAAAKDMTPKAKPGSCDRLTALPDRENFVATVSELLERGCTGVLLDMNLDEFKYVNGRFGKLEGDELLIRFANLLAESADCRDAKLAHLGGDEYAAYLPGVTERAEITRRIDGILANARCHMHVPDHSRMITVSIGAALFPEDAVQFGTLLDQAIRAMLFVKSHGKNSYCFYDSINDRHEELVSRHYETDVEQEQLLHRRNREEKQIWVKFGEYRLIWQSLIALSEQQAVGAKSVLLTFRLKSGKGMDDECGAALNESVYASLRALQTPGIFTWYSISQLLVLSYQPDGLPERIDKFIQNFIAHINGEFVIESSILDP